MRGFDKKELNASIHVLLRNNKKGVSPVIATIMLVSLSLILAVIVFMWARGFVSEQIQKNGQSAEYSCEKLQFEANFISSSSTATGTTGTLQVVNRGSLPIYGFDIKQVIGGTVKRTPFAFSIAPGETLPSKSLLLLGDMENIEIYPILLGSVADQKVNKQYTCLHNAKKIQLNQ